MATITQQPVNCTAALNSKAKFSVTASGSSLTYKWQYSSNNGSTWSNYTATGYNTNTITVTVTSGVNNYLYRCIVTDSSGSVTSSPAVLIVGTPVNWVSQLNINGNEYAISSKEKMTNIDIILDKDAWVSDAVTNLYKYTAIVIGLTEDSYCELGLAYSGATPTTAEMRNFELITGAKTSYNTLEIYAESIPEIDMTIVIKDYMS